MIAPFTPSFYKRLQQLKIRTRRTFVGSRQGSHRSLRKGHGLEFADFRAYAAGDDFRHIDWGVLARTDRMYVREFREEQDLNVVVLLDTSASMGFPEHQQKFELARSLALALGYVALTDGDTVTFSLLGRLNSPRFVGPRAIARAQRILGEATPGGSFDLLTETRAAIARQRIPGKCFFISDFLGDLDGIFATFDYLRSKNFEIVALQVLAPSELTLELDATCLVVDAESGREVELSLDGSSAKEYAIKLADHIERLEQFANRSGIDHLLIPSNQTVDEVVLSRLPEAGILK
ncbi:MAG: DUF58 domain-containing protein [Bdellovibrionales bacterium]|nr:DUF58 domain-containing protein [Bdellovibrionales bacterium]